MYYFLSLLTGVIISVMIAFNGALTGEYGVYTATVFIHIVGLLLILFIVLLKRENPFSKRHSWFLYIGGAIGVFTTVANNVAFSRISVSAILALMLFGQSVTGIVFDRYGFFGMPKHHFAKSKLIGIALVLCGIVAMLSDFEVIAIVFSFVAGACIVITRSMNARLAELSTIRVSTFFNYFTGLLTAIPVLLILGSFETPLLEFSFSPNWYIYFGGVLGVCVVLLSNVTVVKISAFYLTLLIFIGQVFSGVLVDIMLSGEVSFRIIIGGVFVTAGLCLNLLMDYKKTERQNL